VEAMQCLPDGLVDRRYYQPTNEGREKLLAQRIEEVERIRSGQRTGGKTNPK
jgi:putative ATPase